MAKLSRKQLAATIVSLMADADDHHVLSEKIAAYLIMERRTGELNAIMRDVARLREAREGVLEANISSAFPVTEEAKNMVRELFPGKKVIINETLDKHLLGGIQVEANGQLLDASIRRQLNALKQGVTSSAHKGGVHA